MVNLKSYPRQTISLMRKNFLLFSRRPIRMLIRALIVPLILTFVFSYLKEAGISRDDNAGFGSAKPIRSLSEAMSSDNNLKLVFVRNNNLQKSADSIIDKVISNGKISSGRIVKLGTTKQLGETCQQTLAGTSDCFAAVVFNSISSSSKVNYTIVIDSEVQQRKMNWRTHDSAAENRVLPLQWALDSAIGGFEKAEIPDEMPFGGGINLSDLNIPGLAGNGNVYYLLVSLFVAPFFFLIFIDVIIYTCGFIARERENGTAELLTAQGCRKIPQIASAFLSFWILYLPAFIACGLVLGLVLFNRTNAGIIVLLQILAGTAVLAVCMFSSTFFKRGNFAGPVSAIFTTTFACVFLAYSLNFKNLAQQGVPITVLSAIFPAFTYACLIGDIARLQAFQDKGFSLSGSSRIPMPEDGNMSGFPQFPSFAPGLYPLFFLLQTVIYIALALLAHRLLWYVPDTSKYLDPSAGLALRITNLSKTYRKKRAVNDLSFEVKRGAVVCLLGPNGGGKTTTLRCIAGMHKVDRGSNIELSCKPTELGICPQHNVLWGELTVREHIVLWANIKGGSSDINTIESIIQECDLVEKANSRAGTLSGGQKRKLQLAISFVAGSKIVAVDEASSGLDPLSRRTIWNIMQKGSSKRTIIMTTHFLDEADILSDHVVIISKGKLVCEGPSTTLKAKHGDKYVIADVNKPQAPKFEASSSAEAHAIMARLERENAGKYEVSFPTLEQVFLKVANGDTLDGNGTTGDAYAIRHTNDEQQAAAAKLSTTLDHGKPLNLFQQIGALFIKRYMVLKHNWIAVILAFGIPIAIAAAVRNGAARPGSQYFDQNNCREMRQAFADGKASVYSGTFDNLQDSLPGGLSGYSDFKKRSLEKRGIEKRDITDILWNIGRGYNDQKLLVVGPKKAAEGKSFNDAFTTSITNIVGQSDTSSYMELNLTAILAGQIRTVVDSLDEMKDALNNRSRTNWYESSLGPQLGVFAPTNQKATLSFSLNNDFKVQPDIASMAMNLVSNIESKKQSGPAIVTNMGKFNKPPAKSSFLAIPFATFIAMGFVLAFSTSIIYPAYERNRGFKSQELSNGVRPLALWAAYLLFELQIIFIVAFVVFGLISAGQYSSHWYQISYLIGAIILFGIATCFGCFLLSLYFGSRSAYPMAVVIHLVLMLLYVVANILTNVSTAPSKSFETRANLQAGFALISPGANLVRAFFIATNAFSTLCGKWGEDPNSNSFAYELYGGVYLNLIIQILFLSLMLVAFEYGWFSWLWSLRHRRGAMAAYEKSSTRGNSDIELVANSSANAKGYKESMSADALMRASHISKRFGKSLAVDDVSLGISPNETLALLGPNGAGKTTTINMIRGDLKPDTGDVYIRDYSVLKNLVQARSQIGVCLQEDAVDDLSVAQTLKFYCMVKGVPKKNIQKNVDAVIDALRIQEFRNRRVSKLSGGTKRKLSVAISLLGNPPVLLLDEPSTGQDAASKRALWRILRVVSNERAILLTTHSLEEAEALASNVAIVSTRVLVVGTTTELRDRHGGFYHVRAVIRNNDRDTMAHEANVRTAFEGVNVKEFSSSQDQIKFSVAMTEISFAAVMERMEMMKRSDGIVQDYTVNSTTLEEVFLNVVGNTHKH